MTEQKSTSPPDDWPSPKSLVKEVAARVFTRQLSILAMGMLIVVLAIHLLQQFATILQQLLVAVFVIYLILPFRQWLARRQFSPAVSYIVIILSVVLVLWILGLMIQESLSDLQQKSKAYEQNLAHLLEFFQLDAQAVIRFIGNMWGDGGDAALRAGQQALLAIFSFAGQVIIVLIYVAFLLAEAASLPKRVSQSFEGDSGKHVLDILSSINSSISRYIAVKTFVSLLTGLCTFIILWLCGVDYALLWGIVAFLLNYIPYLGSIVAVVLPGLLAMIQETNTQVYASNIPAYILWGFWIMFLLNAQQTIIGYWLEPVLAGKRLDLSPFIIIFSLAFWGSIWGLVGMILAVPLVVSLKIVLENIPATRPIARLLSHFGGSLPLPNPPPKSDASKAKK